MRITINDPVEWSMKKTSILSIVNKFEWEEKRQFLVLIRNIDEVCRKLGNAEINYRRHPNTGNTHHYKEAQREFNEAVEMLTNEMMICKLASDFSAYK